jgi:hypothetical protein
MAHTDSSFYALAIKQLVGINRSNDVSHRVRHPDFPA